MSSVININNLIFSQNEFVTLQELNKRFLSLYNAIADINMPTSSISYATSAISGVSILTDNILSTTDTSSCITTKSLIVNEFPQFLYPYINFSTEKVSTVLREYDNTSTIIDININSYVSALQRNTLFITGELVINENALNTNNYLNTITIPKNMLTTYFNTGKILFCSFNLEKNYHLKSNPILVKNNSTNIEVCIRSKKEDTLEPKIIKIPFVILFEGIV